MLCWVCVCVWCSDVDRVCSLCVWQLLHSGLWSSSSPSSCWSSSSLRCVSISIRDRKGTCSCSLLVFEYETVTNTAERKCGLNQDELRTYLSAAEEEVLYLLMSLSLRYVVLLFRLFAWWINSWMNPSCVHRQRTRTPQKAGSCSLTDVQQEAPLTATS